MKEAGNDGRGEEDEFVLCVFLDWARQMNGG